MTREDLIKLAREAGIEFQQHRGITGAWNTYTCGSQAIQKMERFAALVAAAERSKCARVCREIDAPASCNETERLLWGVAVRKCSREVEDRSDS